MAGVRVGWRNGLGEEKWGTTHQRSKPVTDIIIVIFSYNVIHLFIYVFIIIITCCLASFASLASNTIN